MLSWVGTLPQLVLASASSRSADCRSRCCSAGRRAELDSTPVDWSWAESPSVRRRMQAEGSWTRMLIRLTPLQMVCTAPLAQCWNFEFHRVWIHSGTKEGTGEGIIRWAVSTTQRGTTELRGGVQALVCALQSGDFVRSRPIASQKRFWSLSSFSAQRTRLRAPCGQGMQPRGSSRSGRLDQGGVYHLRAWDGRSMLAPHAASATK
jgi:hypothetical protein